MSATLDAAPVARLLAPTTPEPIGSGTAPGVPVVASEGRGLSCRDAIPPARARRAAGTKRRGGRGPWRYGPTREIFSCSSPGAAEIRRTAALLDEGGLPPGVAVVPLHGMLSQADQDRALAPSPPGRRTVVLATSIAETSLTIEGVRVVIDSGVMRVPRFSPRTGMTRLETVRVTTASANQRRGRAGRLGPGICYRLWHRADDDHLLAFKPPRNHRSDLVPLALELAEWGVADPAALVWLDPPAPRRVRAGAGRC